MCPASTASSSSVQQTAQESSQIRTHVAVRTDVGLSSAEQAFAGSAAQFIAKLALYPLDTWKSRRQARRFGALGEFKDLWTVRGMFRGLLPKLALYTPYQAIYMAAYVRARDELISKGCTGSFAFVGAGVVAEICGSAIRLPMEVAKVRLQVGLYRNSWHALTDFCKSPLSFYRLFVPQTLTHDCIYSAFSWYLFESTRQKLFILRGVDELPALENMLLGTFVGGCSALATTPLDVIKTRMITAPEGRTPAGVWITVRTIMSEEGARAFGRGAVLRMAHVAPSYGLYMALYEVIKMQIPRLRGYVPLG
jgi:hypothetical protein